MAFVLSGNLSNGAIMTDNEPKPTARGTPRSFIRVLQPAI